MRVGYVRISTASQKADRQTDLMEQLDVEKVYSDVMSGKNTERPQLQEMFHFLREGDELIVESISRLARNTKDLLELTERLKNKGVKFVSKKENIDTSTPTGKFMLTVLAAMAELERDYILERQAEGIASAKRRGAVLGRPKNKLPENWDIIYNKWCNNQITGVEAMKILGLRKTNFYKLVKNYETKK